MFCSLCTQPCISFALCAAQMHSRFFRSLLRYPGHPYRSDVMVAKPPASKPRRDRARSPAADRRRNSAEGEPSTPDPAQPSETADQPAEQTQPAAPSAEGTPERAALEAWFNNLSPAERQRLIETQPSSTSASSSQQPPQEPAEPTGQAQSVPAEPSVASPKASRKQPPYNLKGRMVRAP